MVRRVDRGLPELCPRSHEPHPASALFVLSEPRLWWCWWWCWWSLRMDPTDRSIAGCKGGFVICCFLLRFVFHPHFSVLAVRWFVLISRQVKRRTELSLESAGSRPDDHYSNCFAFVWLGLALRKWEVLIGLLSVRLSRVVSRKVLPLMALFGWFAILQNYLNNSYEWE